MRKLIRVCLLSIPLLLTSCGEEGDESGGSTVVQDGGSFIQVDASGESASVSVSTGSGGPSREEERVDACVRCCNNPVDGIGDDECFENNDCSIEDLEGTECAGEPVGLAGGEFVIP